MELNQDQIKILRMNIADPIISNKRPRGRPPLAHKYILYFIYLFDNLSFHNLLCYVLFYYYPK
jgi:hypothetical protein